MEKVEDSGACAFCAANEAVSAERQNSAAGDWVARRRRRVELGRGEERGRGEGVAGRGVGEGVGSGIRRRSSESSGNDTRRRGRVAGRVDASRGGGRVVD